MSLVDIPDVPLRQIFQSLDIKTVGLMTCTSSSIHNFIVNNNVLCGFHKNIHKLTIKVMGNENDEYAENLDENAIEVRVEVNRRTTKLFRFLPDSSWETSKDDVVETYEDEEEPRVYPPLSSDYFLCWLGNILSNSAIDSIELEEFCLNEEEMEKLKLLIGRRKMRAGLVLLSDYFHRLTWKPELLLRFLKMMNVTRLHIHFNFMRVKKMKEIKPFADFMRSNGMEYEFRPTHKLFRPPLTDSFDGLEGWRFVCLRLKRRMDFGPIKKKLHDWARGRTTITFLDVDVSCPYRNVQSFLDDLEWPSELPSEVSENGKKLYLTNIEGTRCRVEQYSLSRLPFMNMWEFYVKRRL